jgi:protein-tyrosine kinase
MSRIEDAFKRAGTAAAIDRGVDVEFDAYPVETTRPTAVPTEIRKRPQPAKVVVRRPAETHHVIQLAAEVEGKVVVDAQVPAAAVEEYRRLAATLHLRQEESGMRSLMVSSALPSDGKTLTATNLALTLSDSYSRRVLLIDADLRRPSIHEIFKFANLHGLFDSLVSDAHEPLSLVEVSPTLSIVPAGRAKNSPLAALTSDRMAAVIAEAKQSFDWVIVDTPPVGLLSDANLLTRLVDGVLVVIGAGTTSYVAVQRALAELGRDRVVGVVLNRVADPTPHSYYEGYYGRASRTNPA